MSFYLPYPTHHHVLINPFLLTFAGLNFPQDPPRALPSLLWVCVLLHVCAGVFTHVYAHGGQRLTLGLLSASLYLVF